jgi:hypothetical protein
MKKLFLFLLVFISGFAFAQASGVQEKIDAVKQVYDHLRTTPYNSDDVFQVDERLQEAVGGYNLLNELFKQDRKENIFSSAFREELETINIYLSHQISILQFYKDRLYKSTESPDKYHL